MLCHVQIPLKFFEFLNLKVSNPLSANDQLPSGQLGKSTSSQMYSTVTSGDRRFRQIQPTKRRNLFRFRPEVTHSLIVNMQDGDPSQAERCWTEESPGNNLQIMFRNFKTMYSWIYITFTCFR